MEKDNRNVASINSVTAGLTVRILNLVTPLAHKATAMHTTDTASSASGRSGAVSPVIGASLRQGDVDSVNNHRTTLTTPSFRTSTTAIRITTTRTTATTCVLSADTSVTNKSHAGFLFEHLVRAYFDCRKHKRNTKSALAFEVNLERNLIALFDSLVNGTYQIGKTICFDITHPKPREVWAADFPDRIVHHFFYNHVAPRFQNSFIADSCACIVGRGTLYAAKRLESKIRSITQNWSRPAYYLKLDLANFFVSIDKYILRELLVKKIPELEWRALGEQILMHDPRQHYERRGSSCDRVPAHKRLANHPAHLGLPIGNLSSQFFANIYLNELDQFVKHKLGAKHYARYVDDFILLHESPQQLNVWLDAINEFLPARLNAQINPSKTILQPIDRGVDFVGQVIKPHRRTARRRVLRQAIKRVETIEPEKLLETANSYYGLLRQSSHSHADRAKLTHAVLDRGRSVNRQLTKSYRGKS